MSDIDLVLFDCDGVLVDSEIIAARIESDLLTAAGYPIEPEEIASVYAGLTFKQMLLRIEKDSGQLFQANLLDEHKKLIERRLASDLQAIEGVHEAVHSVTTKRCICSNSSSERLKTMLTKTHLISFFGDNLFSAGETPSAKLKPAPDVYLYGAEKMGANPKKCFVVEDSVHGVAAARAAGMRVIGFTGGSHSQPGHADQLTEAGAETVIRRWADFPAVLEALSQWSEDA
jgi:HAD superfamily hydrolase (TIGR01509 family)